MGIFNKNGMLVFPNPLKKRKICDDENVVLFTECYCQNGHNLISDKAKFDEFNGIFLNAKKGEQEGVVALSPVYGCKTRVVVGMKIKENDTYDLYCPKCNEALPAFSNCHCGGKIIALFLNKKAAFDSFIGVCNRIGCANSYIQLGEELITSIRHESV
ncbi:MAG: hypothetical protein HN778_09140 [Prolixibacteraceae bacterium]|mgnify:CR=1 FL=1|nr:hypothetical protein [Prolixibacteraceae bacterium]MBT6006068.1 hypothetical protein [Prolixibacteraceae bacterium]MBT6766452.1 hypothetical protein [Prolixibacteraceae bacterium]MBT6999645.1 hypothetical protein [Prolixibacteraceae bacterium]MBT7394982.1 hypothetical protein [Prolixibacteraceae bacterium]